MEPIFGLIILAAIILIPLALTQASKALTKSNEALREIEVLKEKLVKLYFFNMV